MVLMTSCLHIHLQCQLVSTFISLNDGPPSLIKDWQTSEDIEKKQEKKIEFEMPKLTFSHEELLCAQCLYFYQKELVFLHVHINFHFNGRREKIARKHGSWKFKVVTIVALALKTVENNITIKKTKQKFNFYDIESNEYSACERSCWMCALFMS